MLSIANGTHLFISKFSSALSMQASSMAFDAKYIQNANNLLDYQISLNDLNAAYYWSEVSRNWNFQP